MNRQRAHSTTPGAADNSRLRSLSRGTVGDLPDFQSLERSWSRLHLSKKRSQYYNEAFAYREPNNTAKDRVARDSVILAELKLNFLVSAARRLEYTSDLVAARVRAEVPD